MMSDLKDIKARHDAVRGYFADQKGTDAHLDRAWLIEEVERLEKWKAYHEEISKNRVDLESDLRAEVERLREMNIEMREFLFPNDDCPEWMKEEGDD